MRRGGGRILIGLLLATAAAWAEPAACSIRKGLYDEWLSVSKRASGHKGLTGALLRASPGAPDVEKQQVVDAEYRSYFQCLYDTPLKVDANNNDSFCDPAADRLGSLVCQGVRYLKNGRTGGKDFIEAFPNNRKAGEMLWDLEEIMGPPEKAPVVSIFQPEGPVTRLIDELFLLVLDEKDSATARYLNIWATATGADAKHMDDQMKLLVRESPGVVIKEWPTVRQYQPAIKKLVAEMAATLPKAEMNRIRQQATAFCSKDNLDCPEILKLFGRPE
jgi:hypothetical protein